MSAATRGRETARRRYVVGAPPIRGRRALRPLARRDAGLREGAVHQLAAATGSVFFFAAATTAVESTLFSTRVRRLEPSVAVRMVPSEP